MAAKKPSPAMDFVLNQLKKNKKVSYGEVAEAARKKGYKIFPIMYGRAKALLGLVPMAPRGSGKRKATARGRKRQAGRPRKEQSPIAGVSAVISAMKEGERERERYRKALNQIQGILENTLEA